ncbi:DEAD-box ATP-dependent RNA helicase 31 [Morella rubra]|uniref:ATP-dependent RNA helicase n=1 Tax=Morella rubra TaxID=262757 RepID=A0A6A1W3C8_9ROSI|nr:DEAD-box ATP-dependent RNA helicase 31 [Morella rubra]
MPVKLLPQLRLLNPSLPVTRFHLMNLGPSVQSSRAVHVFSRIFPLRLRYSALESPALHNARLGAVRRFSTRQFRPRTESGAAVRTSREKGEVRASKSLIDDEAELSDWVSELRTDSFRGQLTSDDEASNADRSRGRTWGSDREKGRESFPVKRRRENDSGEFRGSTRNPIDSFSRNSTVSRFDREDDGLSRRKSHVSRGGKVSSSGEFRESTRNPNDLFSRNSQTARRFDREDDALSRRKNQVSRGGKDDDNHGELLKKSAGYKEVSARVTPGKSDSYLSETRFDQCSVSPLSLKGIKDAGYEKMTVVQEATLPEILKGKDVLAKAKTGTGKTVAFLLPSIEAVVNSPPIGRDQKRPPIFVLVICPTRELANQAAAEANTLLKYHPSIGVQVVIGGTRLALEQKRMQANPCQILVATPGRLKDHIENTPGFATRLMGVKVLVLDEADHLLDMGFRKDIEKIIAAVPKQRQTLLFSATVPEEVRQMYLVSTLDKHFSLLYVLLKEHIADDVEYKVLVFCTTAMVTRLVANLLGELNLNVREIHSRKPQSYRTRVSDEFRKSKGLILVTSDVSARGVDYPDVTLVIQVGLPADREQYIHRLGRTGRKGKEGDGILLLTPWEEFFLSTVKELPITMGTVPSVDPDTKKKVERALSQVEMKNKEAAYQAWLGYYNSNKKIGRDKHRLVELANEFSRSMGLDNPPAIPKIVLGKMGLRNIPGLRSK